MRELKAIRETKPNYRLQAARDQKMWTQEEAADNVGVDHQTYWRWENGEQRPHYYSLRKLCEVFGKSAEELGFGRPPEGLVDAQWTEETTNDEETSDRTLPSASPPPAQQHESFIRLTPELVAVLLSLLGDDIMAHFDPEKRGTLRKILAAAGIILLDQAGDPEPWEERLERLAGALKKPSRIDLDTLGGLRNTTANYWQFRRYGSVASPDLLDAVLGHLRVIKQLLRGSHLPSTRTYLNATASETGQLAGMLFIDMNYHDAAQPYYQFALERAQEANDDALYAAALGRMSTISAATGEPREALLLLQEAQLLAVQSDAFTLRSWLAAEEAEAQADLQDIDDCSRALESVERSVSQIQPGEKTYGTYFDSSRLPAYRGACFMRLGRPEVAMPALLAGLKTQPEPAGAFSRAILLDLANTSRQAGEIEQACSYIHQSLDIITQTNAARYLQRVYKFRQQLEPWAMVQDVKNLDRRLKRLSSTNREGR